MNKRSPLITSLFIPLAALAVLSFAHPAAAATSSPVVGLTAGDNHTCAVREDGVVECWGDNAFGQLGNPEVESTSRPVPVALPADAQVTQVAAGAFHTCALTRDARVYCWGYNGWGSLGIGDAPSASTPQLVTLAATPAHAVRITAGGFTTCVALSNGAAQCWGRNQYYEVGDGTRAMRNTPTPVTGIFDAVDIEAGVNHVCVVRAIGKMQCWGRAADGRTGDLTYPNVALVSAGGAHTCVRTATGGLHCWGSNTYGQLTTNNVDAGIARIATGANHTCAATEAGAVVCWGLSTAGQLGDTVQPAPGSDVVDVVAGANHTCVLTDRAAVLCWGDSTFGQAGDHSLTTSASAVELIAATQLPAAQTPQPAPVDPQPVNVPVTTPIVSESPAVEKQAAAAPASTPDVVVPAPQVTPKSVTLPRLRVISARRGAMLPVTRVARAAGVRVPSALIVSSLNPTRSISNHAWSTVRIEMSVPKTTVCRNVLTPSLTAALRVTQAGSCYVTVRVVREGKLTIVRTVVVRSVVPVNTARPNRNDARHPL